MLEVVRITSLALRRAFVDPVASKGPRGGETQHDAQPNDLKSALQRRFQNQKLLSARPYRFSLSITNPTLQRDPNPSLKPSPIQTRSGKALRVSSGLRQTMDAGRVNGLAARLDWMRDLVAVVSDSTKPDVGG